MTLFRTTGSLMLGSRFKRLGEKFIAEVTTVYRSLGIPFEPAWFPVFYLLDGCGQISVSDIARELEVTQSAASQLVSGLEKKGLLRSEQSPADRRVRYVQLTDRGEELKQQIKPVWTALSEHMQTLLEQGEHARHLLSALNQLEASLASQSLAEAILQEFPQQKGESR